MPLEEKYEKLRDQYILVDAINFAFHKELEVLDKYYDLYMKVHKKSLSDFIGAFEMFKEADPSEAFKQFINQLVDITQWTHPLSNIELTMVSDREATLRVNNCPKLKRTRELVDNVGLNIRPVAICAREAVFFRELGEWFGVDMKVQFEKEGCVTTVKLK